MATRTTTRIQIITKLSDDVGGKRYIEQDSSVGPRALLKAVSDLPGIRKDNIKRWGNIGAGGTWIEIDGVRLTELDLLDFGHDFDQDRRDYRNHVRFTKPLTATDVANAIIDRIVNTKAAA